MLTCDLKGLSLCESKTTQLKASAPFWGTQHSLACLTVSETGGGPHVGEECRFWGCLLYTSDAADEDSPV